MTGSGYDAVVVGAGPAGSIAALVLARGGARVALADKALFPRDKACGDLIGPRGVQVLADLGLTVPDAGHGSDLLAVGPSGRRGRLPAFTGRSYPGHGIVVPRVAFDHALREAALAAGAVGVRARITAVDKGPDGPVRAVLADGQRLAGDVIIGADGALSTVARLTGMLDSAAALWGFAVRAYVPGEVPLPLLVLLESAPWRIYPGYGWLFPAQTDRPTWASASAWGAPGIPRRSGATWTGSPSCCARAGTCARTRTSGRSSAAGCAWAGPGHPRPRATSCWWGTRRA